MNQFNQVRNGVTKPSLNLSSKCANCFKSKSIISINKMKKCVKCQLRYCSKCLNSQNTCIPCEQEQ